MQDDDFGKRLWEALNKEAAVYICKHCGQSFPVRRGSWIRVFCPYCKGPNPNDLESQPSQPEETEDEKRVRLQERTNTKKKG